MFIPHSKPYLDKLEQEAAVSVIKSGHIAMGKKVIEFEEKLAKIVNKKFAICVDSGFSALRLSLIGLNINKNDRVGFPAYSCVAIMNAILSVGAIPVPLDNFLNSDVIDISCSGFVSLSAIIVVHTFGNLIDIARIKQKTNIPIIEDCAHAFGTKVYGVFGDLVVLSFYATKLIGIGEGGAILTNFKDCKDRIIEFRSYVDQSPNQYKFNNKMTDIEAALGICQLNKLREIVKKRAIYAEIYNNFLRELEQYGISLPEDFNYKIWYRYVLRVPKSKIFKLKKYLFLQGIYSEIPINMPFNPDIMDNYPNAKISFLKNLSLPLYPSLTNIEQMFIIKHIKKYFHANG